MVLLPLALLFVGYVVLARCALELLDPVSNIALLWPAAGLAAGGVALLWGRNGVVSVAVVAAAALAANMLSGNTLAKSTLFAFANSIEALVFALLFRRKCGVTILSMGDVGWFGIWAAMAAATGALIGTAGLWSTGIASADTWLAWCLADLGGIITFAPLLLVRRGLFMEDAALYSHLIDLFMPLGAGFTTWLVVAAPITEGSILRELPGVGLLPLVLAVGFLARPYLAAWSGAAIVSVLTYAAIEQIGLFMPAAGAERSAAMVILFMLTIPPTILVIAIGFAGLQQAKQEHADLSEELGRRASQLEQQVAQRNAQLDALNQELVNEIQLRQQVHAAFDLKHRDEAKDRISSGIAHDFNNIVAAVASGFSLIAKWSDDKRVREVALHGGEAAARGGALVRRLMVASQRQDDVGKVHLAPLIANALPLLKQAAPGMPLAVNCAEALPPVRVNPIQLEGLLIDMVVYVREQFGVDRPHGAKPAIAISAWADPQQADRAEKERSDDKTTQVVLSVSAGDPSLLEQQSPPSHVAPAEGEQHPILARAHASVLRWGGLMQLHNGAKGVSILLHIPCIEPE